MESEKKVEYRVFSKNDIENEEFIFDLISKDLSEPYSIYVYRYFIYQWPSYCYLAILDEKIIGIIISKLDVHRNCRMRGYIAMLAVSKEYRGKGYGSALARKSISAMKKSGADEIVLETESSNKQAIALYTKFGFVKVKKLKRYYLNGNDAVRLILPCSELACTRSIFLQDQ